MSQTLSIVIPCYNEQEALPQSIAQVRKIMAASLPHVGYEILLVDDGSTDGTLGLIKELAREDGRIKYLSFSRNFGKEAAIYAGLSHACGAYVVMMDADLQDPPELLPQLYHAVTAEGFDSAATRRVTRRGEPVIRSLFARLFYKLIGRLSNVEIMDGARDFRIMNRKFVDALLDMKEYNRFSKGLFGWVGFHTKWIEFENVERVAGETKWSFWKLFKYSVEGLVAFSTAPLVAASLVGFLLCSLSGVATVFIVVRKLLFGDPVDGWSSLACIMCFVGGIQLFFLGIVGQYLAKTYMEVKNRPIYVIGESNVAQEKPCKG